MNITRVSDSLEQVWPLVSAFLTPAINQSGGRYTTETTRAAIMDGDMQLWIAFDESGIRAALTTSIVAYPAKKMLAIIHCGGRGLDEWLHTLEAVESWARSLGCDGAEIIGRAGWAKALPGYSRAGSIIERYF